MTTNRTFLFTITAIAVVTLGLLISGVLTSSAASKIVIEWGMYPEEFEGLDVRIDGESAGQLEMLGRATRTVFPVDQGQHTVQVMHPSMDSEPITVDAALRAQSIFLVLDVRENTTRDGSSRPVIAFQR